MSRRNENLNLQKIKKRKKIIVTAVILAAVLLVSAILFCVMWEPKAPEVVGNIIDKPIYDISSVKINTGEIEYTVSNDIGFPVDGYESALDISDIANVLLEAQNIPYTNEKALKKDLSRYGIDKEGKSITVNYFEGEAFQLLFGDKCSDFEYYAADINRGKLYRIPTEKYELLMKHPAEYRNKIICEIDAGTIESFTVSKKGNKEVSVEKDKDFVPTEYQTASYLVTYPYNNVKASLVTLQYIFEATEEIIADSIVEEKPSDLAKYGLTDDKKTSISFTDANKTATLFFGDEKDGKVYTMCEGTDAVYLAERELYNLIKNYKSYGYIENFIAMHNIKDVKSIEITSGDKKRFMEIFRDNEGKETFKVDGKDETDKRFRKLYRDVIAIDLTDIADKNTDGKLYATVTYTLENGQTDTYNYYDYDSENCMVTSKDNLYCVVLKSKIDKIFEEITEEN